VISFVAPTTTTTNRSDIERRRIFSIQSSRRASSSCPASTYSNSICTSGYIKCFFYKTARSAATTAFVIGTTSTTTAYNKTLDITITFLNIKC
jgi:hypothetical protein